MADQSITATSVAPGTDIVYKHGIFKSTTTHGQTAYLEASAATQPPTWGLLDTNTTDELAGSDGVGVFMNGGAAGQPCVIAVSGNYNPGFTATVGEFYVGTATAGGIAHINDIASGWKPTIIGYATTTTNIKLIPHATLVALLA